MKRTIKVILQRILCFVLIASLVSQNGLQTVSARPNRPGRNNEQTENPKGEHQKDSSKQEAEENAGSGNTELPEIISEIEGRRGAFSKEYLRSDNSRTVVVYPQQVHYETEDGSLVEIDNSLTRTEEGYENGSNSYDLLITDNEKSQGQVIYQEDGYEISWQMIELMDTGTLDGEDAGTGDGGDVSTGDVSGGDVSGNDADVSDEENPLNEDAALDGEDVSPSSASGLQMSTLARKKPTYGNNQQKQDQNNRAHGKQKKKVHRPELKAEVEDLDEQESEKPENEGIHRVQQSRVTLEGYADNVRVEYEPAGDGIKENIILADGEAGNAFAFCIQTKGLVAELTDNNEIEFSDEETGEVVYYFPAPFMMDSKGELSYDAAYELVDTATVADDSVDIATLYIKIVLDEQWLKEAAYPVTVDPVLKQCRAKNLLDSGCVVSNNTMRTDLYAGKNGTGIFRSYVKFALPELPTQSVVSEAILDLSGEVSSSNTHYIQAKMVTEQWYNTSSNKSGKKLAWNSQPQSGDLLDYTVNGGCFDITKAVRQWMNGTKPNYGVALMAYDESVSTTDKLTLQYSKSTPYFKITYRTAVGLESYWGTHSTGAGTAGAGYINDYTGALTVVNTSVATAGNRFPMSISHVYNSNAPGNKWHLNYEESIKIPIDTVDINTYPYVYTDSDGTEHYFKKKEVTYLLNGASKTVSTSEALPPAQDEDGLKLYIVPVTDSALKFKYPLKLIDKSASTVKYFDAFGRLALITDSNQFESGTNSNTKTKNCVTIGFESYGSALSTTTYDNAVNAANTFKTQCYKSGVTATSSAYTSALDALVVQMELLKKDAYARADYTTAKHIRTAMTALAALNEVDSTPTKTALKNQSTAIYNALVSARTRAKTLTGQSNKRIKTIQDAVGDTTGNIATITYNGTGQIASITDPAYGGSARFAYSGGNIAQITFANNEAAYYTYDSNGLMTSQQDHDGYRVTYGYSGNRITDVSEYHKTTKGQTYSITYNTDNSTTFRFSGVDDVYGNSDDILNIHVFDEQGRAVCIYSKSVNENKVLGATACTYQAETDNGGTRNKIKDTAVVGMHTNNLLANHSFEYNDGKWTLYKNDTGTPESGALNAFSTAKKYIGTHSAFVNMAKRTSGTGGFKQNVWLTAGTYTFSGYVSAESISNTSAYLKVKASNGTVTSNKVTQATSAAFDNGWERLEVTFTVPSPQTVTVYLETDCGSSKGAGKVYFDCIQLESGTVANDYNILEDGSFELTSSTLPYQWTNLSASGIKKGDERIKGGVDGSYCYHITGQPGKDKYLRFTTNLGGSTNGYVLSGWVQSDTTPVRDSRAFKAMAYCEGSDAVYQATGHISSYSEGWKYFCLILPAAKWGSTKISICFYDNIGDLYIDGLQLTRNDVQTKSYDAQGRITSSYTAIKSQDYQYDDYNRVQKHTKASGLSNYYVYDKNNEVKKVTASVGPDTHYTYDKYGNVTVSQSFAEDATASTKTQYYSSNTYTSNGNFPASSTDVAGNTTTYTYNEKKGQLLTTTLPQGSSAGTVTVEYEYDNSDRLSSVAQSGRSVGYSYNTFDELTGISHNGFTYGFTYDGFGNVLTTSIAGKVISTNQYAANNGSLKKTTLADGTVLENTYDKYGNITSNKVNGNVTNKYTFDNDGNLSRQVDKVANLTTKYDYNESDKVVRSEVYTGEGTAAANLLSRMQYTYTKSGLVAGLSYAEKDGKVRTYTYAYANDELPTKSTLPDGSYVDWTYDVLRRNTRTVYVPKSGVADSKRLYTVMEYQNAKHSVNGTQKETTTGLVKTYRNKFGSNGSTASQFDYTYDSWGNITGITYNSSKNRSYTYNAYGEVTKAVEAYSNGTSTTYTYTYDAGGNILTEKAGSTTHTYKYDSVWKDKLISYDGKAITYDESGHPLNYMGTAMSWDVHNNLTAVTKGSTKISYSYQSTGERCSKTVNGTTTTYNYNNGLLLSETKGNETLRYYYDSTGKVMSIGYQKGTAAEVLYFFARNGQEDVIAIYRNSDSKLIGTYEYDLWGRLISVKEASSGIDTNGILSKNPIRYRGYYYDSETGFYYLNARYYDASVRRFISADDMEYLGADETVTGFNLFVYCGNNPVKGFDPTGHWDWGGVVTGLGITVGALAIGIKGGVSSNAGLMVTAGFVTQGVAMMYAAATDSVMVMDVSCSYGMFNVYGKVGASIVVDYENDESNLYWHLGGGRGCSKGISGAVGIVENYSKSQDYAGWFVDYNAGYYVGGDYCRNPDMMINEATQAKSVTFGNGLNLGFGFDWFSNPIQLLIW